MADPTFEELGTRSFGTLSLMSSGNSGALNLNTSTLGDRALDSLSDLGGSVYGDGSPGSGGQESSGDPLFKPVWVTSTQLSSLNRVSGQLIVATDTGDLYVDTSVTRIHLTNTSLLANNQGSANSGKYLTVNSTGEVVTTDFPTASTSVVGGVKVDGTVVSVDASNCLTIDKNQLLKGTTASSIAIGIDSAVYGGASNAIAIGKSSGASAGAVNTIAVGYSAQATKSYSTALGSNAGASKPYSTAIGCMASVTGAQHSIQLGMGTNSSSTASFCVGWLSANYTLMDLTTGKIPSARIPGAGVANAGKCLTIDSSGEIVATSLPVYSGSVTDNFPQYNGEVE